LNLQVRRSVLTIAHPRSTICRNAQLKSSDTGKKQPIPFLSVIAVNPLTELTVKACPPLQPKKAAGFRQPFSEKEKKMNLFNIFNCKYCFAIDVPETSHPSKIKANTLFLNNYYILFY
jgi:hypothetical protein